MLASRGVSIKICDAGARNGVGHRFADRKCIRETERFPERGFGKYFKIIRRRDPGCMGKSARGSTGFIQTGKPMQNGFTERFNRSYLERVLGLHFFKTLEEVRERAEAWMRAYNEELPHGALNDLTPVEYKVCHHSENSISGWH